MEKKKGLVLEAPEYILLVKAAGKPTHILPKGSSESSNLSLYLLMVRFTTGDKSAKIGSLPGGRDNSGALGWTFTTIYKTDNQQGPTI